jgi:hypothetical protein
LEEWELLDKDFKNYPHFDHVLSRDEIYKVVRNPDRVARNAFYPFIKYLKVWQPYRRLDQKPSPKERLIRYAARRDAYIFAYYRFKLSQLYEHELKKRNISEVPIAYRRILTTTPVARGKCNINFASEAFSEISSHENCVAITFDVSKFFESLDHQYLLRCWKTLLGVDDLPSDHLAVFKAITSYAFVDRLDLYRRLGFFGFPEGDESTFERYLVKYEDIPKRKLCSNQVFRELVCGGDKIHPSIVQKNRETFGIPQGAPISDLLANLYLLEFDSRIAELVHDLGGYYRRYSDDILLVLPISPHEVAGIEKRVRDLMNECAPNLVMKESKTSIVHFHKSSDKLTFTHLKGKQGKNGLEYLGFRFDGQRIYLRDGTVSGLYRKIALAVRYHCREIVSRFPGKDLDFLRKAGGSSRLVSRFGRVEDFDQSPDVKSWTFWTYAKRASEFFGSPGRPILRQIRGHKDFVSERFEYELVRAVSKK